MWQIGPECAAQQAKKVRASTMNCRERKACASEVIEPAASPGAAAPAVASTGRCRTRNDAGISNTHASTPMSNIAVRQSYAVISQRANGEIVSGATPMPAETSETARLRCVSNHAVVAAVSYTHLTLPTSD